jgi:DNA-binding MarR family transcriptional regulator
METVEESVLQLLAYAFSESKQAFARYIGMSQARYQLLANLSQKGEISHAALQQHLGLDGATITRLVKQFEAEGLVSRRLDPRDNRYTLASLTDAGRHIVAGISEAHQVFVTRMLDGIAHEELEITAHVLEYIRTNIRLIQEEDQGQG